MLTQLLSGTGNSARDPEKIEPVHAQSTWGEHLGACADAGVTAVVLLTATAASTNRVLKVPERIAHSPSSRAGRIQQSGLLIRQIPHSTRHTA